MRRNIIKLAFALVLVSGIALATPTSVIADNYTKSWCVDVRPFEWGDQDVN